MSFRCIRNIGLGALVVVLIGVGLIPTLAVHQISHRTGTYWTVLDEFEQVVELQKEFWDATTAFNRLVETGDQDFDGVIENLQAVIRHSQDLTRQIEAGQSDLREKKLHALDSLSRHAKLFRIAVSQYAAERQEDPGADNTEQLRALALEAMARANTIFSTYGKQTIAEVNNFQAMIGAILRKGQKVAFAGAGVGIGIGIAVAFILAGSLSKPIQRLVVAAEKLARGELGVRVPQDASDEIGQLAVAFNTMSSQLAENAQTQEQLTLAEKQKSLELSLANTRINQEMNIRRKVEKLLLEAKEQAEDASQAKSEFLANMSHELRTPLNHIIGFTELVVDGHVGELNPAQSEYLSDALGSSQHLLSLINDILDLSKVEAGKMDLTSETVGLTQLLEGSLTLVKESALKAGIALSLQLDGIPKTITADGRKLKQILYNLLSNAVKFTPEKGSVTLGARTRAIAQGAIQLADGRRIKLPANGDAKACPDASAVEISVRDSGIGLDAQMLEHIFNPFEQVENSKNRQYQGTGLGLALTRNFVELHGGAIWAESAGENQGATFSLVLPHCPIEEAGAAT
ncbi:MAG: ATP-binding protein [Desulfobacterales bacterium]